METSAHSHIVFVEGNYQNIGKRLPIAVRVAKDLH